MDLQLRKGRSAHYCFVSEACALPFGGEKHGAIQFNLEFVRFKRTDPEGNGDNIPEGSLTMTLPEFAAWWAKETEWRVESV